MRLRELIYRGGIYLALRQSVGMIVGFGGLLVLTRTIGPGEYGTYAAALGIYMFVYNLSQWGIGVYLIRREGTIEDDDFHSGFTFLLVLGVVGVGAGWLGWPLLERLLQIEDVGSVGFVMLLVLPLHLIGLVPKAYLERRLDYKPVAWTELSGQLVFYGIALPVAFAAGGAWAPAIGWLAQQVLLCGLFFALARYAPSLQFAPRRMRAMVRYGLGYSSAQWVWQLRDLINPVLVGRLAGAEAVGLVALAIRIVSALSFVKNATWRVSMSALAKFQHDSDRLRRAIDEGMRLQLLALGPVLLGFMIVGPPLILPYFGETWEPLMHVLPLLAVGYLLNAAFNLHASTLYVLGRNWSVAAFHGVHVAVFAGSAWLLVPSFGVVGYAWSGIVAAASYGLLHVLTARVVGALDYRLPAVWLVAFSVSFFWQPLGIWAFAGLAVAAVLPATWSTVEKFVTDLKGLIHAGS